MVRTLWAWGIGIPGTVLWGSLSLLGSLVDRSGRRAHACMVAWSRLNLRLMGTRVEVEGLDNLLADSPQVFAANHQSMADILLLAACLPVPFRFVAKRELFDLPFLGWHMRRAGFIAIDRSHPRRAARALLEAAERIAGGVNALVFPEGTRSRDGSLLPFHGGGFLLAIRAGVPVTPIAIRGSGAIHHKGHWTIRPATARLVIGKPVDCRPYGEDREALGQAVRAAIERGLQDPGAGGGGGAAEARDRGEGGGTMPSTSRRTP